MVFAIRGSPDNCALPLLVHVPHASRFIPDDVRTRILLSDDDLAAELDRVTDHRVDELFASALELGGILFINQVSRLVVDSERFRDDDQEPAAASGHGAVYLRDSNGDLLRDPHRYPADRQQLLRRYYDPCTTALQQCVETLLTRFDRCLIIDAHSYPRDPLPWEQAPHSDRPDIDFGADSFHTPQRLLDALVHEARSSGLDVAIDVPFAGTYVPISFFRRDDRVCSVMIEIRRDTYQHVTNWGWMEILVSNLLKSAARFLNRATQQ